MLRPDKDEVKFVIADMADWEFAKETIEKYDLVSRTKEVLISPVHGIENLAEVAEADRRERPESSFQLTASQIHMGSGRKRRIGLRFSGFPGCV